jgi:predicted transposase/invertase (TIGR01784 family)
MAQNTLESISQNEKERYAYRMRRKYMQDQTHQRMASFMAGEAKGREEGIGIGVEKGREALTQQMTQNLYKHNMPTAQIGEILQLSEDAVKRILGI